MNKDPCRKERSKVPTINDIILNNSKGTQPTKFKVIHSSKE